MDVGIGYSNVVIQGNRLYTMGIFGEYRENLAYLCLDAGTGKVLWRRDFESGMIEPQSTPVIDGERVYGLAADGALRCLRAANGKVLWEKDLELDFDARRSRNSLATSPAVEGDLLLLNANTAEIALDKKTGELKWSVADKVPPGSWGSYATTVVGDLQGTRCALFLGPSPLNAVEVTTGKKLWSYPHKDATHPISDPTVFDNQVFVQLIDSCALLEGSGAEPRVVDGYLYGSHWPREYSGAFDDWATLRRLDFPFRCVEWKTGRVVWEKSMKEVSTIAANGKLIMLEVTGILHIAEASPASYQELSSADALAGANKQVFCSPTQRSSSCTRASTSPGRVR